MQCIVGQKKSLLHLRLPLLLGSTTKHCHLLMWTRQYFNIVNVILANLWHLSVLHCHHPTVLFGRLHRLCSSHLVVLPVGNKTVWLTFWLTVIVSKELLLSYILIQVVICLYIYVIQCLLCALTSSPLHWSLCLVKMDTRCSLRHRNWVGVGAVGRLVRGVDLVVMMTLWHWPLLNISPWGGEVQ